MGGSPVAGARFGGPNQGPRQRPKIDPKSTPILLVMLAFSVALWPAYESVGSGQIVISANQVHSQNDTLILAPFDDVGPSRMDTNRLARRAQKWPKSGRLGPPNHARPPSARGRFGWLKLGPRLERPKLESRFREPESGRPDMSRNRRPQSRQIGTHPR